MPTSWNVTPHRYEHGKPVMTGDKWKALDLNDERVVNECEGIVENLGAAWIRARLDFYGRWLDQLFGLWAVGPAAAEDADTKGADGSGDADGDVASRIR